jgi:8-oxo-dGTP pyrophosphatase MutT (NUDIX family)
MRQFTSDFIRKRLSEIDNPFSNHLKEMWSQIDLDHLRPAAVLMPLLEFQGHWHLLLTHRSEKMVEHRGQVAFPGGARERGDPDLSRTALREVQEEIGVDPKDVQLFGHLKDMPIITGYCVRPFVGQMPWPYPLKISPAEVESVFIVPLHWLVDPDHRTIKFHSFAGREFPVIYFDHFEGHQLWGASAEMTIALLEILDIT